MGVQMLVSDYLDQVIKSRPLKYSTQQSLIRHVKRLGIADQLCETTMNPDARTLRRITIQDTTAAKSKFELLMGNDFAPRKEFIFTAEIDRDRIDA
jgi:DNA gyrase/topoisomerase IV subunit B